MALNRTISQNKSSGYSDRVAINNSFTFRPFGQNITIYANASHSSSQSRTFEQALVDYPRTNAPDDYRNKYLRDHPNRNTSYSLQASWHYSTPLVFGEANYQYRQQFLHRDYEYNILSRLEDWNSQSEHQLGELPSETDFRLRTLDAQNSYDMREITSEHQFGGWITFALNSIEKKWYPYITLTMPITIRHNRLDYRRGNLTESVYDGITRKDFVLFNPKLHMHRAVNTDHYNLYLEFNYEMQQQAPQMTSLLEIENTSDPLNIYTGNHRLKKSTNHNVSLSIPFRFNHTNSSLILRPSYNITKNAIAYGYTYSPTTGVRHYRPQNVDGNYQIAMDINYNTPFKKQKLTLSTTTHGLLYHGVDLVAQDGVSSSTTSSVNTWWGTEDIKLNYTMGKHTIGANAYVGLGHVSSNRLNFSSYTLCDFHYGLTALIQLPWALQLSTDLTMYSRRGYATSSMNTNDLVWNARLTKTFTRAGIILALDGFDILGNLSNTSQLINTQGRTETYRNSLPRYLMFHCIYRLNKKPKKHTDK